jgi:uncharacterized protein YicC (UPF0701 family)
MRFLVNFFWGWDLGFCGSGALQRGILQPPPMDPSWNDLKKVLRRSEEIAHSNSLTLHHLSSKFEDFEQALDNLTISRNQETKVALQALNRQMEKMESKIQQIKAQLNTWPMEMTSYVHGDQHSREEGVNSGAGTNG